MLLYHQYHNLPFNNKLAGPFQSMNSPICFISRSNCTTVTVPPKLQLEPKCKKQEKAEEKSQILISKTQISNRLESKYHGYMNASFHSQINSCRCFTFVEELFSQRSSDPIDLLQRINHYCVKHKNKPNRVCHSHTSSCNFSNVQLCWFPYFCYGAL